MDKAVNYWHKLGADIPDDAPPELIQSVKQETVRILNDTIKLEFPVSREDLKWVHSFTKTVSVEAKTSTNQIDDYLQHPRLKIYEVLAKFFVKKEADKKAIEIGPDCTSDSKAFHACSKLEAHNTYRRCIKAKKPFVCTDESCSVRADSLFSTMVFDISVDGFLDLIEQHGAAAGTFAILLDNLDGPIIDLSSNINIAKVDDEIVFTYGNEYAYVHNYENYTSWLQASKIGAKRGYIIEIVHTLNLLKIFKIAKARNGGKVLQPLELNYEDYTRIPIPQSFKDLVLGFDKYSAQSRETLIKCTYRDTEKVNFPTKSLNKVIHFSLARTDKAFNRANFSQMIRSMGQRITTFSGSEKPLELPTEKIEEVITALFMYASALRKKQTKDIGSSVNLLNNSGRIKSTLIELLKKIPLISRAFGIFDNISEERLDAFVRFALLPNKGGEVLEVTANGTTVITQTHCQHGKEILRCREDFGENPFPRGKVLISGFETETIPIPDVKIRKNMDKRIDVTSESDFFSSVNKSVYCEECTKDYDCIITPMDTPFSDLITDGEELIRTTKYTIVGRSPGFYTTKDMGFSVTNLVPLTMCFGNFWALKSEPIWYLDYILKFKVKSSLLQAIYKPFKKEMKFFQYFPKWYYGFTPEFDEFKVPFLFIVLGGALTYYRTFCYGFEQRKTKPLEITDITEVEDEKKPEDSKQVENQKINKEEIVETDSESEISEDDSNSESEEEERYLSDDSDDSFESPFLREDRQLDDLDFEPGFTSQPSRLKNNGFKKHPDDEKKDKSKSEKSKPKAVEHPKLKVAPTATTLENKEHEEKEIKEIKFSEKENTQFLTTQERLIKFEGNFFPSIEHAFVYNKCLFFSKDQNLDDFNKLKVNEISKLYDYMSSELWEEIKIELLETIFLSNFRQFIHLLPKKTINIYKQGEDEFCGLNGIYKKIYDKLQDKVQGTIIPMGDFKILDKCYKTATVPGDGKCLFHSISKLTKLPLEWLMSGRMSEDWGDVDDLLRLPFKFWIVMNNNCHMVGTGSNIVLELESSHYNPIINIEMKNEIYTGVPKLVAPLFLEPLTKEEKEVNSSKLRGGFNCRDKVCADIVDLLRIDDDCLVISDYKGDEFNQLSILSTSGKKFKFVTSKPGPSFKNFSYETGKLNCDGAYIFIDGKKIPKVEAVVDLRVNGLNLKSLNYENFLFRRVASSEYNLRGVVATPCLFRQSENILTFVSKPNGFEITRPNKIQDKSCQSCVKSLEFFKKIKYVPDSIVPCLEAALKADKTTLPSPLGGRMASPKHYENLTIKEAIKIDEPISVGFNEYNYKLCQLFKIKIANFQNKYFVDYAITDHHNKDEFGSIHLSLSQEIAQELHQEFVAQSLQLMEPYSELHAKARDNIKPPKDVNTTVKGFIGRAGSGKSTTLRKKLGKKKVAYVVPSNKLREEYKSKGFYSKTIASFLAEGKTFEKIVLDEVFVMHPYTPFLFSQYCEELFIIGDCDQTLYGSKEMSSKFNIFDLMEIGDLPIRNISYSVPLDATYTCRTVLEYPIFTRSSVKKSIFIGDMNPEDVQQCFTRNYLLFNKQTEIFTAPKIQGSRTKNSSLALESSAKLIFTKLISHFVVNFTRHTERLTVKFYENNTKDYLYLHEYDEIYKPGGALKNLVNFDNDSADFYEFNEVEFIWQGKLNKHSLKLCETIPLEGADVTKTIITEIEHDIPDFTTGDSYFKFENSILNKEKGQISEMATPTRPHVDVSFEIAAHLYNDYSQFMPIYDVNNNVECSINFEEQAFEHRIKDSINFNFDEDDLVGIDCILEELAPTILEPFTTEEGARLNSVFLTDRHYSIKNVEEVMEQTTYTVLRLPLQVRGRTYLSANKNQAFHTATVRSRGIGFNAGEEIENKMINELFQTFTKYVKPDVITADDLCSCLAEYLSRVVHKKDFQKMNQVYDDDFYELCRKIEFFHKVQTKKDLKPDSFIRYDGYETKAGQSVCPEPAGVNNMVSAFFRCIEKKILSNVTSNIYLHFGKSKDALKKFIESNYKPGMKHISSDYTEFDTFHDRVSDVLFEKIFEHFHLTDKVLKFLNLLNISWTMDGGAFKIDMKHHLKSGKPDTLLKNTIYNMCLSLTYLEVVNFSHAAFCGDDSVIVCKKFVSNNYPDFMKSKVKLEKGEIGSFVGYLIADTLYLDIPRVTVGVVNKNFGNAHDSYYKGDTTFSEFLDCISEYQLGIYDYFSLFDDQEHVMANFEVNALIYNTDESEIETLMNFLVFYAFAEPIKIYDLMELVSTETKFIDSIKFGLDRLVYYYNKLRTNTKKIEY